MVEVNEMKVERMFMNLDRIEASVHINEFGHDFRTGFQFSLIYTK